jgi:hypothetical protein
MGILQKEKKKWKLLPYLVAGDKENLNKNRNQEITYSKGRRGREAFSIHPSRHPSMNGIIQGRKPWQK